MIKPNRLKHDKPKRIQFCGSHPSFGCNNNELIDWLEAKNKSYKGLHTDYKRMYSRYTNLINEGGNLHQQKRIKELERLLKKAKGTQ